MAVGPGNKINADEFNSLQNRVSNILGNGFRDLGYGQSVKSFPVNPPNDPGARDADLITVNQINNLREDIAVIYKHQTGNDLPIPLISNTDLIGADESGKTVTIDEDKTVTIDSDNIQPLKGFRNFISEVDILLQNRFDIANSQSSIETIFSDARETAFNGAIDSEFRLSFLSADDRRHFFNSGGEIRIGGETANLGSTTADSYLRNQGWADIVTNPGEITFGYNYTKLSNSAATNVTLNENVGNYQLTSSYQIIFKKEASSGTYSDSYWQIEVKENSSSSIDFKISLVDSGPESNLDAGTPGGIAGGVREPVTTNIEFIIEGKKSDGAVQNNFPAYLILSSFED